MVLLALAGLHTAAAATLTVGPSGRDHTSVQAAVDAANDGDTVAVDAGTYTESVSVAKDITLTGVEGSSATILATDGTVLTLTSADATVSGFTLSPTGGRGVSVRGGTVALRDLVVTGGDSDDENGAGIYALETALTLDDSTLSGNDAGSANGGNLYLSESTADISGCTFELGLAEKGAGLYAYGSEVSISRSSFSAHEASNGGEKPRGGAIRGEDTTFTLLEVDFSSNIVNGGYGGHISAYGGGLVVESCTFSNGVSIGSYGGAIVAYDADLLVSDSSFTGNSAQYLSGASDEVPNGGAVVLVADAESPTMSVTSSTFSENSAEGTGGAMRLYGGTASITSSTFSDNSASRGGAVYATLATPLTLESSELSANGAGTGGAIYWAPGEATGTLSLRYCELDQNSADDYGGGLYAYGDDGGGVSLAYSSFTGNTASVGGGAMLSGVPSVSSSMSTFCANAVDNGDADGAGVLVYESGTTLNSWTNNLFVENVATSYGGGLMVLSSGAATVRNNHFVGNGAERGGGAYFYGQDVDFTNNLVAFNDEGDGVYGSSFDSFVLKYNDLYENDEDPVAGVLTPEDMDASNLQEDPLLTGWTDDGDCSNDMLWPADGSPLVDAGDPEVLDADGGPSDIGAYGGPDADWEALMDTDGDGSPAASDCDDNDATVYPGAEDTPYDGADQDCDGLDLRDVDADGYDATEVGGDDCDDGEPTVNPGATEVWYDGVDGDCDGAGDFDQDADGHDAEASGGDDCDDQDSAIHPGAVDEAGDGVDSDCDLSDGPAVETDDTGPTVGDDTGVEGETGGGKDGGCSCSADPRPRDTRLGLWALAGITLLARRRRAGRTSLTPHA